MKLKIYTILLIIVSAFIVFITYNYFFVYHIELNGDNNMVLGIDSKYKELGATIKYRGEVLNNYFIENNVDTKNVGEYFVKYKIGNSFKLRKVKVKDIEKPTISLTGQKKMNISYGSEFVDPGFVAVDDNDGDITSKVSINGKVDSKKLGSYDIKYIVSDSSNNKSEVIRKVNVIDDEGPKIKFKGNLNTYAILGEKIDLNDYTSIDNYDGDITSKVIMSGNVDFDKEGVYKVTYLSLDSNGNSTKVERTVNVQSKNKSGIPVLMYHWFYDDTKGESAGSVNAHNYIAKTELEKQLKYVTEENFYFPTWQELIDYIDNKIDLPEKSVIFTDDDCDESMFDTALPLFQEYKVPVTSYCITRKDYWKKFIGEDYLDFESHTNDLHTRRCKGTWDGAVMCSSYNQIYDDIKISVDKVGGNTWSFAYPFGHYNNDTIQALKDNDIKLAFTINSGRVKRNANKYKLPRVRISKGTSINQYKNLLN